MSRPQAKTTWGELAMFGHPKQDVFKNANAWRGGTMHSPDQMSLNDGFAAKYEYVPLQRPPPGAACSSSA